MIGPPDIACFVEHFLKWKASWLLSSESFGWLAVGLKYPRATYGLHAACRDLAQSILLPAHALPV